MDRKAEFVRRLFAGIPAEYDQLLWMLTLRQDVRWRRKAIRTADVAPGAHVLDLATGTGVFAFDWIDRVPGCRVTALDITPAMLAHARRVLASRGSVDPVDFVGGRTESLPFPDRSFDAVSIGLALRNLSDLEASFCEMARVLRPGGRVVSVDFTRPGNALFRRVYYLYLCRGLPAVGRAVSREWDTTFEYLWRSILRFRPVDAVVDALREAGFVDIRAQPLTGGIATLLSGRRP